MNKTIILLLILFLAFSVMSHSMKQFTIQETEKISLQVKTKDPDMNNLTTTYTPPLNEKGEWQTTYGDAGEYKSTITVSDGINEVSENATIIVEKKEEPPKIESVIPTQSDLSINEGDSIDFRILATDVNKDNLSYSWFFDNKKIKDGQEFSYNSDYKDSGSHKILAKVSDGTLSTSNEWNVNVANVERDIVFDKIGDKAIKEGEEIKVVLNAKNPDEDEISYSADPLPEGARLEGNVFSWKPDFDTVKKTGFFDSVMSKFRILSRKFYVQFTAVSKGKKAVQNIAITVKDVNRAPVLEDMEPITINEGESLRIIPKAYDLDGDKVSLSYSGFISSDTFKSGFDDAGTYYVKVTASDGLSESSKFVQIKIKQSNRSPVFSKIEKIKAKEGEPIAILLNAFDADGDKITYSLDNPPEGSSLKGNVFSWTPSYDFAKKTETKKINLVFAANDGKAEARQIAELEIHDKNRAPKIIDATKSIVAKANKIATMSVKAIDEDGDELTYTWSFGLFEKYKGDSTHQRVFRSRGQKTVKVIVSDGTDETEQIITVNVV